MAYTSRHSGRRIRALFEEFGYDDRTFYTNAVKCFPDDSAGTSNREPTDEERHACRGHLLTELEIIDPTVVVPTGKHATITVLEAVGRELDGFLDVVLDPIDCPQLGVAVLPLLHPSYQEVWLSRLGYEREAYVGTIGAYLTDTIES